MPNVISRRVILKTLIAVSLLVVGCMGGGVETPSKKTYLTLRNLFVCLLFVGGFFVFANGVSAATYYVATNGSDSNDGLAGTTGDGHGPKLTLTGAHSAASNGDTVYIAEGTYTENGLLNCWYTTKGIAWIANGSVIVRSISTSYVLVAGGTGATFTGITFDAELNTGIAVYISASNVSFVSDSLINLKPGNNRGFVTTGAVSNINISYSTITDNGNNIGFMILVDGASNVTIDHNTFLRSNGGTYLFSHNGGSGYSNITNNTVTDTSETPAATFFTIYGASKTLLIDNNTVTSTGPTGTADVFDVTDQVNPIIRNNRITTATSGGSTHIAVDSTGIDCGVVTVANNTLTSNGLTLYVIRVGTDFSTAGDEKVNNALIYGNRVYARYHQVPDSASVAVHAVMYGYSTGASIYSNAIYGGGYGLVVKGASTDWQGLHGVYNNLFVDNGGTVSTGLSSLHIKGIVNMPVFNNVFINNAGINNSANIMVLHNTAVSSGIKIKNNISYIADGTDNHIDLANDGSTLNFADVDYNLYHTDKGFRNGANAYTDFAHWQAAGFDTHGVLTDPKFLFASDFHLANSSPAIDSGIVISGFHTSTTTDFAGNPIYGTPDIGAYEYQPPYTLGTHEIETTGNIRIYGDKKFRYTTATTSTISADFNVSSPETWTYSASTTRPEWLNISNMTWTDDTKQWTASSTSATTTIYTIGDLTPNTRYAVAVDSTTVETLQADSNGHITYTYTGGYSTHTFTVTTVPEVSQTPSVPQSSSGSTARNRVNNLVARGSLDEAKKLAQTYNVTLPNTSTTSTTIATSTFNRTLRLGMSGDDVKSLQQYLNTHGFTISLTGPGSLGNETTFFGALTKKALIRFQEANAPYILTPLGLKYGTGLFGEATRGFVLK